MRLHRAGRGLQLERSVPNPPTLNGTLKVSAAHVEARPGGY